MIKRIISLSAALVILSASVVTAAFPSPNDSFYVYDGADVISEEHEYDIAAVAYELDSKTKAQIAVVTVDFFDGLSAEDYATGLFNEWALGGSKESNGILILFSIGDREIRIEVGKGLEKLFTGSYASQIVDDMVDGYFAGGYYDEGLYAGFTTVAQRLYSYYELTMPEASEVVPPGSVDPDADSFLAFAVPFTIVIVIVLIVIVASFSSPSRNMNAPGRPRRYTSSVPPVIIVPTRRRHRPLLPPRPPASRPPHNNGYGGFGGGFGGSSRTTGSFGGSRSSGRSGGFSSGGRSGGGGFSRGGGAGRKF